MEIVTDLKPCPFCGGVGAVEPHFYEGYDEEDNLCELVDYFAYCTKCGVSTPFMSCEETAQEAWEERFLTGPKSFTCCCKECKHLERVNGRIIESRCAVTGISFPKYANDRSMIHPETFSCNQSEKKGGGT